MKHVEFTDQGDGTFSWSITTPSGNVTKASGMSKTKATLALASTILAFKGEYQITFKHNLK